MNRKVISSSRLAKELLNNGFQIIDIAPNRNDSKRTVFIFENTFSLNRYLNNRKEENESAKTNQNNKLNNNEKFSRVRDKQ